MGLTDDDRKAIVCYRIEKAFHTLKEAKDVLSLGHLSLCANRLYYSAFYMASALLINHGHSVNTHAGVLRLINLYFVKEGKLDKNTARLLNILFSMRQQGDYSDTFDYEKDEIEPLIKKRPN
ncbi:HEPN domain-containing protein [Duncaniella freteri]|uniref:HEPN domain-containing protein n=1 Tax=Duncaniella freteri TaxID=2530391 RepID=UPI0023C12C5F|nr:HEPN domain-containing protein [Duncaniella freteri]MDE7027675.1 HEPN domain-containing protein [Duncaniella freteri]